MIGVCFMTVKELIEILETLEHDKEILIDSEYQTGGYEIKEVIESKEGYLII